MRYKRDKKFIESIPEEWRDVPLGTVCKDESGNAWAYGGWDAEMKQCIVTGAMFANVRIPGNLLTPITQWEPKEGEVVAAWDDDEGPARLLPYVGPDEAGGRGKYPHKAGHTIFRYIARVPDDMLAKDFPAESAWWIANGELYEANYE